MKKKLISFLAIMIAIAAVFVATAPAQAVGTPRQVSYVVMPHPDDEWQMWGMIEGSSDNYKILILLTQGEQTSYCGGVRWTQECKDHRINSWLGYWDKMAVTDPSLPANWAFAGETAPLPTRGYSLNVDNGAGLVPASTSAKVWTAQNGMGAAVVFDMGDADLTKDEVTWAIETVRDNRALLGIDSTLPNWNAVGTFYNDRYSNCAIYSHKDHRAVHEALWSVNFGFRYQSAASCATDPDGVRLSAPSQNAKNAAWGPGGAFPANYGWLGGWAFSEDQRELFHGAQRFWTRMSNP